MEEVFTKSGVRLRCPSSGSKALNPDFAFGDADATSRVNWLFLPGGPGLGSESLQDLVDVLAPYLEGSCWLVDLPGDGSNTALPEPIDFRGWPDVVAEAAEAMSPCVFIGHSTGGMYLLSVPKLEEHLKGLVLISSAPDARWQAAFVEVTQKNPLPEADLAAAAFQAQPDAVHLRDLVVASAEWSFTPGALEQGRTLLRQMPYNCAALEWFDRCFDSGYAAQWWPKQMPTLILSGRLDQMVDQSLWMEPRFQGTHVLHRWIDGAAHYPWVEQPEAVREAFLEFSKRVNDETSKR